MERRQARQRGGICGPLFSPSPSTSSSEAAPSPANLRRRFPAAAEAQLLLTTLPLFACLQAGGRAEPNRRSWWCSCFCFASSPPPPSSPHALRAPPKGKSSRRRHLACLISLPPQFFFQPQLGLQPPGPVPSFFPALTLEDEKVSVSLRSRPRRLSTLPAFLANQLQSSFQGGEALRSTDSRIFSLLPQDFAPF